MQSQQVLPRQGSTNDHLNLKLLVCVKSYVKINEFFKSLMNVA